MTDAAAARVVPFGRRRSSLRIRVVLAILLVAMAPELVVFAWSQLDRSVPGRMWGSARDAAEEATAAVLRGKLDEASLRAIARRHHVRLRVLDRAGQLVFDDDEDSPAEDFDRVERFFLGASDDTTLHQLDDDLGPVLPRPEVQEALRSGAYIACGTSPLVFCQAVRVVPSSGQEAPRIVYVELSSRRLVEGVYGLRYQLLRLSLVTFPIAVILALYTGGRVVRPIERLRRQALERAKAATPGAALAPDRADEVAVLADAFNSLLSALESKRVENEAFVADLVHEMKNPVAAMRAAADLLRAGAVDGERAERLARVLGESTAKLDRVATQFLELARAEAGMPNEDRQSVDLTKLIGGLVAYMKDDERHSKVRFVLETPPEGPLVVQGVDHRLDALFRELLENAASFAGEGGEVKVTLSSTPGSVNTAITDTGPGILPEDLPRVFSRFFTTRGRQRGTGLGLALVQAVAEAHGGGVSVQSTKGQGATFAVTLPRARPGSAA